MALNQYIIKKLQKRDPYCLHCGEDRIEYLVPHHRKNRGMGGRGKSLDSYENLLLICAEYNGAMEADSATRELALTYNHKLSQYGDLNTPVFDTVANTWYKLLADGTKTEAPEAVTLF